MKVNRALRRLSIMLAVLLLLVALAVPAFADAGIDMERSCSLQLSCFYENEAVSGGNLLLYQVAAVESEDGNYYFRLDEKLGGGKLTQQDLDRSSLAGELAGQAGLQNLGSREETFGNDGYVRFQDLRPGLYLLVQTKPAPGYERMDPVLVSIPFMDPKTGEYTYDVDATVKPAVKRETEPSPTPTPTASPSPTPKPGPKLPQTGQLNWPVPVLACGGVIFVVLGLWLLGSDRRRSQP